MDLKTSFAFYFVSLALYLVVLTSMALADRRVIGARWLAYSVLVELIKVGLQVMGGSVPHILSVMVVNELDMAAFFTMYLGLRWFVKREDLEGRMGPMTLLVAMAAYCAMYVLHIPYAFDLMGVVVLWLCALSVRMMLRQREERFRIPAGITAGLLSIQMLLMLVRMGFSVQLDRTGMYWRVSFASSASWVSYALLFVVMLSNCVLIMYVWFAAAEMYSAVEATAGIDALTGCLNRRALMKVAAHEMARSERTGLPLTIVALDLDHFKQVNDNYGHAGGDAVLCAVVALLHNRLRMVDVVARTGGEEFLVMLPDTDAVSGVKVVDGLRQAIEAMSIQHEGQVIRTTASAGVTQNLPRVDSWNAMANRADRALYAAKGAGRNRVVLDETVAKLPRRMNLEALDAASRDASLDGRVTGRAEGAALRLIRRLG